MERIKGNCALPQPAAPLDSFFSKRLHIKRDLNPVLPRGIQTCFETVLAANVWPHLPRGNPAIHKRQQEMD